MFIYCSHRQKIKGGMFRIIGHFVLFTYHQTSATTWDKLDDSKDVGCHYVIDFLKKSFYFFLYLQLSPGQIWRMSELRDWRGVYACTCMGKIGTSNWTDENTGHLLQGSLTIMTSNPRFCTNTQGVCHTGSISCSQESFSVIVRSSWCRSCCLLCCCFGWDLNLQRT